jgi:hypothetical protein
MSLELSKVITTINGEINSIIERNLLPHFETIRIIENLLKQMPEFKRLEQENADLKQQLSAFDRIIVKKSNEEIIPPTIVSSLNEIKLEIVESSIRPAVSESELYTTVNLLNHDDNKLQEEEADTTEEEADTTEEEAETSEEEEEEEEEEADEADEEEDEEEADEEVASEAEEVESDEEVASEAEEADEADEGEDPLEDGVEGAEPLAEPLDEEVYIIEIKGKGKFYTSNETNGDIYQIEGEDDVGDIVGKFVNKVATFL